MDPVWFVVGSVVGTLLVYGGGVWTGWSLLNDRLASVEGELARITAERDAIHARETARARGARSDLERAEALARAHAAGDDGGVLHAFPDATGAAASQPGDMAEQGRGAGHDPA